MLSIQRFFGAFGQYVILDVRNYLTLEDLFREKPLEERCDEDHRKDQGINVDTVEMGSNRIKVVR